MKDLIEIVKPLEDSGILLKVVSTRIQNKAKDQKGRFLSMLLGTIGCKFIREYFSRKRSYSNSNKKQK